MKISLLSSCVLVLAGMLAAPCAVLAQSQPIAKAAIKPYIPKFVRAESDAEVIDADSCGKPAYPKASLRNEETGTVQLRFKVAANGVVMDTAVFRSSGFRDLDRAAQSELSTCKLRPATINDLAVRGYGYMAYQFTLD